MKEGERERVCYLTHSCLEVYLTYIAGVTMRQLDTPDMYMMYVYCISTESVEATMLEVDVHVILHIFQC